MYESFFKLHKLWSAGVSPALRAADVTSALPAESRRTSMPAKCRRSFVVAYNTFFRTMALFLEPKAIVLHTAVRTVDLREVFGT